MSATKTRRVIAADSPEICMGATGTYVNPLDLQLEDIYIEDIALHLSNQRRFSGACDFTVAQHAVLCVRVVRELGVSDIETLFATLNHDDSEAYLQDVARPLKEDEYFGKAYRGAEKRVEKVIAEKFGITYPYPDVIKVADTMMLGAEQRDLMPQGAVWEVLDGIELPSFKVVPWTSQRSRVEFLKMFENLNGRR